LGLDVPLFSVANNRASDAPADIRAAYTQVTSASQRWNEKKVRYHPPGEQFDAGRVEVVPIATSDARSFIERHHYSRSFPASRFCVGLMAKPRLGTEYLGGVVVYSVPMTQQVIPALLGCEPSQGVELGRLVVLDRAEVGACNSESYFVSRANKLLRKRFSDLRGLVSYCDPLERRDVTGQLVKRSHTGVIYRAINGSLLTGRSSRRTLWLLPDGQVASERAMTKLRTGEQGRDYAEKLLRDAGAPAMGYTELPAAWLLRLKSEGFLRPLAHPGNLRFVWKW
jgi:hypothetical protein